MVTASAPRAATQTKNGPTRLRSVRSRVWVLRTERSAAGVETGSIDRGRPSPSTGARGVRSRTNAEMSVVVTIPR